MNKNKIMRTGIYIRVSTQEQALEGYSIEAQTERLKSYCKAKDWTVSNLYIDPGFSGSNMSRPALEKLIQDVNRNFIDCVLVYKLDRLSRSQKDTLYLIEDIFLKNNVEFVSMNENFDTSTPFGRAMIGILSVFAQLEREQIKERTSMGREERAKNGYWHGGGFRPFGYNYENNSLSINDYEALQVKEIFRRYLEGYSISSITKFINKKYNSIKHEGTVRSILMTPLYCGFISWKGGKYMGKHEPIISEEDFKKVDSLINSASKKLSYSLTRKNPFISTTLLGGILICGNCGARYFSKGNYSGRGSNRRYWPYYYCYSRAKTNKNFIIDPDCKNPVYAVNELDEIIINKLKDISLDPKLIHKLSDKEENENKNHEFVVIEKQLDKINKQINRLLDLYQEGSIFIEDIAIRVQILQQEKDVLANNLTKAKNTPPKLSLEGAKKLFKNIQYVFDNGEKSDKKKLIFSLINKIEILDGDKNFKIHWNF